MSPARRRRWAAVALVLCGACGGHGVPSGRGTTSTSGAGTAPPTTAAQPVPAQYRSEYDQVSAELAAFSRLAGPAVPPRSGTVVGTELLAADGNIGPSLLSPLALTGVERELDAFRSLGIQGVTVDVSFPLLLPATSDSAGYLRFYEEVAQQVRVRHMTLSVEENPVFAGTVLTPLDISYRGLTLSGYAAEQAQQAQIIIDDLHPDYLTLLDEPDTFSTTIGVALDTPSLATEVVSLELSGLHRATTRIGAGTGSWEGPGIDRSLLSGTSIDYLDVHVYPIGPAQLANLHDEIGLVRTAGKPFVMDEAWLYKPNLSGTTGLVGAPDMLKLDSYGFWAPLDARFVTATVDFARSHALDYVSFFDGARSFFSYLPWNPQLEGESYSAYSTQYNRLVSAAMASGAVSPSGQALEASLTSGTPSSTSP